MEKVYSELERALTFDEVCSRVWGRKMAIQGFVYVNGLFRCTFCGYHGDFTTQLDYWTLTDDHFIENKWCAMRLRQSNFRNIPENKDVFDVMFPLDVKYPRRHDNEEYRTRAARKFTLRDMDISARLKNELTADGFFLTSGKIRCFYCGLVLPITRGGTKNVRRFVTSWHTIRSPYCPLFMEEDVVDFTTNMRDDVLVVPKVERGSDTSPSSSGISGFLARDGNDINSVARDRSVSRASSDSSHHVSAMGSMSSVSSVSHDSSYRVSSIGSMSGGSSMDASGRGSTTEVSMSGGYTSSGGSSASTFVYLRKHKASGSNSGPGAKSRRESFTSVNNGMDVVIEQIEIPDDDFHTTGASVEWQGDDEMQILEVQHEQIEILDSEDEYVPEAKARFFGTCGACLSREIDFFYECGHLYMCLICANENDKKRTSPFELCPVCHVIVFTRSQLPPNHSALVTGASRKRQVYLGKCDTCNDECEYMSGCLHAKYCSKCKELIGTQYCQCKIPSKSRVVKIIKKTNFDTL